MRINPAVRWIKPKSPEENGFGSEVYICSEGKELDVHHPVINLVASLARNRGVTFTEIHTLGYTLPKSVIEKSKNVVKSMRFYLQGDNFWTLSKLKAGADPETSIDGLTSMSSTVFKTFTFGLNVGF